MRGSKAVGAPMNGIVLARVAKAQTPQVLDRSLILGPRVQRTTARLCYPWIVRGSRWPIRLWCFNARKQAWSREVATATLVTPSAFPLERLYALTPSRAHDRSGDPLSHTDRESLMPVRFRKDGCIPTVAESLRLTNPHAAGIDVHAASRFVAVPPDAVPAGAVNPEPGLPPHVRKFGTCTADLELLADWLQACGVTSVAMESTGVYWIPLFELLEHRGFAVFLVDPRQTRHAPGRPKSDVLDCQWIQRLHSYGLLTASFRPADDVVELRSYLRQRQMLISYAGQHAQHVQKALEEMNVKLTEVLSDVLGMTGMAIIKAILAGERDPRRLAQLRDGRCRRTEAEIARALQGNWRQDHLFALQQALELYEFYHKQVRKCDEQIEARLRAFADRSGGRVLEGKTRRRGRRANDATFDVRSLLFRMAGVDLTVIEGVDAATALVLLSEIGADVSRFPTVKQFISWLGLCPRHEGSGERIYRSRTRRGANRAARALRVAAQGCHRAQHALGAFYRRIQARAGGGKAVVATARKIGERVYRLLRYGADYVSQEQAAYEAAYRERTLRGLARKAAQLGYRLEAATPNQ
jgi:transposase